MTVQSLINKASGKSGKVVIKKGDILKVVSTDHDDVLIVETKSKQRHSIRKEDVRVITQ